MGGPVVTGGSSPVEASYKKYANNTAPNWWQDPGLRLNMLHCMGLCGTLFFNGYDGSLFNALQSLPAWEAYFDHPTSNILGLMNCAGFLPGLIVCWVSDYAANRYGRRITVWVGSCFAIVGAIIISLATGRGMFIGGRVVLGIGVQGTLVTAPSLLQEIAHPRFRAQLGGFYMCIYYIANIICSGVCRGTLELAGNKSWRIPCFLQIIGPAFVLLATMGCPESPRWLAKNGREKKTREILVKYHANGKEDDELVEYQYREILQALHGEEALSQTRYIDYFKGSGNRRRLLIIIVVSLGTNWVGNGIISYYLDPILEELGITSVTQQLGIQIGLACWNLVAATTAALLVDKAGRRPLWLVSTGGMLAMFTIVMGLSGSYAQNAKKSIGTAVIPFLFLFFGFYDIAWTPLSYSYPVEILPFSLRTKGQAIFVFMQTLGMSVNLWVNPVALAAIHWKYYAVYIAILASLLVLIYFTFPETKNLTIEEISVVFDGDSARAILDVNQGEKGMYANSQDLPEGEKDGGRATTHVDEL